MKRPVRRLGSTDTAAHRNLLLVLLAALLLVLFGIGAETVLFWLPLRSVDDIPPPRGIMTGITVGLALLLLVLGPVAQAASMRVWSCGWLLAAVLTVVVGILPTVAYLALYFG